MTAYTMLWKRGTFGVTWFGREAMLPRFERWTGFWTLEACGFALWRDTTRPETVGERGVW